MKKERNCGTNVTYQPYQSFNPVYPTYGMMQGGIPTAIPGMMPGMPNNMLMPAMPSFDYPSMNNVTTTSDYSNLEQQLNSLNNQLNNLDRRVTRLENAMNNSSTSYNTKYNSSNYQMM